MCDHASCGHHAPSSTTQTLLELDFERGLWVPARCVEYLDIFKFLKYEFT